MHDMSIKRIHSGNVVEKWKIYRAILSCLWWKSYCMCKRDHSTCVIFHSVGDHLVLVEVNQTPHIIIIIYMLDFFFFFSVNTFSRFSFNSLFFFSPPHYISNFIFIFPSKIFLASFIFYFPPLIPKHSIQVMLE